MATNYNPRIVTDGLVLALDSGNVKSVPKTNLIASWTDYASSQAYYDVTGPYSITLKTGNPTWVGYYPATVSSTGKYVLTFKYYQIDSLGSLTLDNDGIMDNAYNGVISPALNTEQIFTKVVDVNTTGLIQFFLRRNSGGNIYIKDISFFKLETTWSDLSGNNQNGSMIFGYNGLNGGCASFDGTSTSGNIIASSTNILTTFTAEAWFNQLGSSSGGFHALFQKEGGFSGGAVYGLRCNDASTPYGMICTGPNSSEAKNIFATSIIPNNRWFHLVLTQDSSYTAKIYVDGILENTRTDIGAFPYQISSNISIGIGDSRRANGLLPIIRVYNKALTAEEIQQNFNALRGRFGI